MQLDYVVFINGLIDNDLNTTSYITLIRDASSSKTAIAAVSARPRSAVLRAIINHVIYFVT